MFVLKKIENGRMNVAEPLYYEVTASEAVTQGEALVLSSGKLTKCGATTKPTFIAISACSATATNREIAVIPVTSEQLYEVTASASIAALAVGNKVTLHTDGAQITATTSSGVATLVAILGSTLATVRFE